MDDALTYDQLEHAPDADLEWFIRTDLGRDPAQCAFVLREVALSELGAFVTATPEDYLADGNPSAFAVVVTMADIYEEHGAGALPPVVLWSDADGWHMLDGHKRAAAAHHARLSSLPAYVLVG